MKALLLLTFFTFNAHAFDWSKCYETLEVNGVKVSSGPDAKRSLSKFIKLKSSVFKNIATGEYVNMILIDLFKGFSNSLYSHQGVPLFTSEGNLSELNNEFTYKFSGELLNESRDETLKVDYFVYALGIKTGDLLNLKYELVSKAMRIASNYSVTLKETSCL